MILTSFQDGDTVFFFNYRSDWMREIVSVLELPEKPMEVDVPKDLVCEPHSLFYTSSERQHTQYIVTMSKYKAEFTFPVAFPPQTMTNVLAEWLSKKGIKQAHVAGTPGPPSSQRH